MYWMRDYSTKVISTSCLLVAIVQAPSMAQTNLIVQPIQSEPFHAQLTDIDHEWRIHFRTADAVTVVPINDLLYYGAYRENNNRSLVVLSDGSILAADVLAFNGESLLVFNELFGEFLLPSEQLRGVILTPPTATTQHDQLLHQIQHEALQNDRVILDNGDVLEGLFTGMPQNDSHVNDTAATTLWITLKSPRQSTKVPFEKVAAFFFNSSLATTARPLEQAVVIGFADGSKLTVSSLEIHDKNITVSLLTNVRLSADAKTFFSQVRYLRPLKNDAIFLSDEKPVGFKSIPFLKRKWKYQNDRNVLNGQLRTRGIVYAKGLGMHSTSRLAYDLPKGFRLFQAEVALDDVAGLHGSVILRVFLIPQDGQPQLAFESPVIRGGNKPLPISVTLNDARLIALIVEFADRGDTLDHANILNARFVR